MDLFEQRPLPGEDPAPVSVLRQPESAEPPFRLFQAAGPGVVGASTSPAICSLRPVTAETARASSFITCMKTPCSQLLRPPKKGIRDPSEHAVLATSQNP